MQKIYRISFVLNLKNFTIFGGINLVALNISRI